MNSKNDKIKMIEEEKAKMLDIFKDVEKSQLVLINGLIDDAAYLKTENYFLKEKLKETGMIKYKPDDPTVQKQLPAAKEYRQNVNSYSVVIKTLSMILEKHEPEAEDEFEALMKRKMEESDKRKKELMEKNKSEED